eukprot:13722288-Ditylum_brightwellii.AAC.1
MALASKRARADPWAFLHDFLKCRPSLEGVPRGNIWRACLSDTSASDDLRAICHGLIEERNEADQLQQFVELCDEAVNRLHSQLCDWSFRLRDQIANQKDGHDLEATISRASASC